MSDMIKSGRFSKGSKVFEICLVRFDCFGFAAVKERSQEAGRG
jgi:hypothetical protein